MLLNAVAELAHFLVKEHFCLDLLLVGHDSVLVFAFALERVLTSVDKVCVGEDSGGGGGGLGVGGGLESGTNWGGLTTLSFTSFPILFSLFCLKCLSQWFTNVSSLTKVLLHTLQ